MNILICDKVDADALDILTAGRATIDYRPEITPDELLSICQSVDALIVRSRTKITSDVINKAQNLRVVGRVGTGLDNIDLASCKAKDVKVINAPDANASAVAEFTIGLMLSLLRKIPEATYSMREGKWLKKELHGGELGGRTVGIVGYGNIGKKVDKLLRTFEAQIEIYSRSEKTCSLEELFERSDIVTLHVPLTKDTEKMITAKHIQLLKPTSYFLNTSRAALVDTDALYSVLAEEKIRGAAIDVFDTEPLEPESRWRKLPNVLATPHIGASTSEALSRASAIVAREIIAVLSGGHSPNIVSL